MFAARYFNRRFYAARYFPKIGAAVAVTYVRTHRYGLRARKRTFMVAE